MTHEPKFLKKAWIICVRGDPMALDEISKRLEIDLGKIVRLLLILTGPFLSSSPGQTKSSDFKIRYTATDSGMRPPRPPSARPARGGESPGVSRRRPAPLALFSAIPMAA